MDAVTQGYFFALLTMMVAPFLAIGGMALLLRKMMRPGTSRPG